MPAHSGTDSDEVSSIVCGSRKSRVRLASATTIADAPSGVKYRLYGSSTGSGSPGAPDAGSIGITLLPWLSRTHNVERSYAGTTCWGSAPVANVSMTLRVAGSTTLTVFDRPLGTYTRGGSDRCRGDTRF